MAIGLVLAAHLTATEASYWLGVAGVSLFCALSGWLITTRLQAGQPLRAFYRRRATRLLPALLVMLAVTAPLLAAHHELRVRSGALMALTYTANLAPLFGVDPWTPYLHTWSLSLEEQFYLLWPVAFLAFGRRAIRPLLAVAALSLTARIVLEVVARDSPWTQWSPLTTAWPLALGCAYALTLRPLRLPAVLAWAPLRWVGVRSYGIYLWHLPLVWLVMADSRVFTWQGRLVGELLAIGAATVSWRWVERPASQISAAWAAMRVEDNTVV